MSKRMWWSSSLLGLVLCGGQASYADEKCAGCADAKPACGKDRVCETSKPDSLCPRDVPCREDRDACLYLKLPAIETSTSGGFSSGGLNTFLTLFNAAAARGVENATVRAFNATRACPDSKDCCKGEDCAKQGGSDGSSAPHEGPAGGTGPAPAPPKPPANAPAAGAPAAAGVTPVRTPTAPAGPAPADAPALASVATASGAAPPVVAQATAAPAPAAPAPAATLASAAAPSAADGAAPAAPAGAAVPVAAATTPAAAAATP